VDPCTFRAVREPAAHILLPVQVRRGLGVQWAVASALAYTLVNVTLRLAAPSVDPFVGSLLRLIPVASISGAMVLRTSRHDFMPGAASFMGARFLIALIVGGFLSFFVGNVLFFGALAEAGLGITASAVQAGSVFTGIGLAAVLLREEPRLEQVLGALVIAVGLVLIAVANLGAPGDTWYVGLVFAVLAGGCYASVNVVTRLVQRERPSVFVTLFGTCIGGLAALIVAVLVRAGFDLGSILAGASGSTVAVVLLAGGINAFALAALTQSMKYTDVATVNTITSASIVFSFVASVVVFGEIGTPAMIVGVVLVVAGILVAQVDQRRRRSAALPILEAPSTEG
jgi:drug/metabolite transporter (DMT)-like permease